MFKSLRRPTPKTPIASRGALRGGAVCVPTPFCSSGFKTARRYRLAVFLPVCAVGLCSDESNCIDLLRACCPQGVSSGEEGCPCGEYIVDQYDAGHDAQTRFESVSVGKCLIWLEVERSNHVGKPLPCVKFALVTAGFRSEKGSKGHSCYARQLGSDKRNVIEPAFSDGANACGYGDEHRFCLPRGWKNICHMVGNYP